MIRILWTGVLLLVTLALGGCMGYPGGYGYGGGYGNGYAGLPYGGYGYGGAYGGQACAVPYAAPQVTVVDPGVAGGYYGGYQPSAQPNAQYSNSQYPYHSGAWRHRHHHDPTTTDPTTQQITPQKPITPVTPGTGPFTNRPGQPNFGQPNGRANYPTPGQVGFNRPSTRPGNPGATMQARTGGPPRTAIAPSRGAAVGQRGTMTGAR